MKAKKQDIITSSMRLFNKEGYQSPGVDRIAEVAGVSKMTFYRYFPDKESLIIVILEEKLLQFLTDLGQVVEKRASTREKLFAIFEYYDKWFSGAEFNGCMFTRAVVEFGNTISAVGEINARFKAGLGAMIRNILFSCLKPEPAERTAFVIVMLIDGAISASQSQTITSKEYPPAMIAWMATKAFIYSEGGTL